MAVQGGEKNEKFKKTDAEETVKQKWFYLGRTDCGAGNHGYTDSSACTDCDRLYR